METDEVAFRPAESGDLDWLVALRTETMSAYIEASGERLALEDQRARVLADFDCIRIVTQDGVEIGMIKVVRGTEAWRLVQIQIVPEHQRRGIGGRIIRDLLADARRSDVPVVLSVLKVNPARHLYERLGFAIVGETDHGYEMRVVW